MSDDKTEKATPQRMKEVRRKGQLQRSQDLTAWIGLGAVALSLPMVFMRGRSAAVEQLSQVANVAQQPSPELAVKLLGDGLGTIMSTVAPALVVVVAAVVVTAAAQGGVHLKRPKPEVQQFNLAKGIKRLVGKQTWWQAIKTLLKTSIVALVLWSAMQSLAPLVQGSGRLSLGQLVGEAGAGATSLLRWGIIAGIGMAILDVVVIMRRNRKQTRMSKQEIKEENKKTEGDPHIKAAIRSKQLAVSRNRMMAAIAGSDVVLVNPTHVAVALRYEPGKGAPRVVAKGAGRVAAKIREEAGKHHVPLVEDIPLARALHTACEIDQEVPAYLFAAVAKVLAFVMALRRRGSAAGQHRVPGGSAAPADMLADPVAMARKRRRRYQAAT